MKLLAGLILCGLFIAQDVTARTLVSVTITWTANAGDGYTILYGKANPPGKQADGGSALRDGPMSVTIGGLDASTTYYFTRSTTHYGEVNCCDTTQDAPLPVKAYFTTSAVNQSITLP